MGGEATKATAARPVTATAEELTVRTGPALFAFRDRRDWVDNAQTLFTEYAARGVPTYDTVAIDANGRVCTRGLHFAEDRGAAYPVTVYAVRDLDEAKRD